MSNNTTNQGYRVGDVHPKPVAQFVPKKRPLFALPKLPSRLVRPAAMFERTSQKLGAKRSPAQVLEFRRKQLGAL